MLTVIFASHNGEKSLPFLLEAFLKLKAPTGGWKLVAVDNASTDSTLQILKNFRNRLPLTILEHAQRGKNRALNAAISVVEGDLVLFTDDDILPEPDWLIHMRNIADIRPEYSIFGGTILPQWQQQPECWLLDSVDIGAAYGITEPNRLSGKVVPSLVWGGNMAVRPDLFKIEGHRFNENIGPGSGSYAMGSETEFNIRMEALGHDCFFVSEAIVRHLVPAEYLTWSWLMGRAYRTGRGYWLRWRGDENYSGPRWFGTPRYLYGNLLRHWRELILARLANDQKARFTADWELNKTRGMITQTRRRLET